MKVAVVRRDGNMQVDLMGAIDETASRDLTPLKARLKAQHAVISLEKVTTINSIGFKGWIGFLKDLDAGGTFELIHCPPVFVEYCCLLPQTAYARHITSVQIPFLCRSCSRQFAPVYTIHELDPDAALAPMACTGCNGLSTPSVDLTRYLDFMRSNAASEP